MQAGNMKVLLAALTAFVLLFIMGLFPAWAVNDPTAAATGGNVLWVNDKPFYESADCAPEDAEDEINGLLAAGDDVLVMGGWYDITGYSFYFYIPEGVTLTWAAGVSGENSDDFMNLIAPWDSDKGGRFVLNGGSIEYSGPKAAVYSADIDLLIENGVISGSGEGCCALSQQSGDIILKGGEIRAEGKLCQGIYFGNSSGNFRIEGGTITAVGDGSYAVYLKGDAVAKDVTYRFVSGTINGAANISDYTGELLFAINGWNGGGDGALTATANLTNDTVTVTGNVAGAGYGLNLRIPYGVTVIWDASLSSAAGFAVENAEGSGNDLVRLTGKGAFVVTAVGSLSASDNVADTIYTEDVDVVIRGTVKHTGDTGCRGAAIGGIGGVTLDGGKISAEGVGNYAICFQDKSEFNYISGELRGAIKPHPGVAHDDYNISYGVRQTVSEKPFAVALPALPAGIGAEYKSVRIYPMQQRNSHLLVVDADSVNISGASLRFSTLAGLAPSDAEADIIDITVTSYLYSDYHIKTVVSVTPEELLLPHQTPLAVIDFAAERLTGLEPGAGYTVFAFVTESASSGSEKAGQIVVTADADGAIPIDPAWFGESVQITRKGDRQVYGDSGAQWLNIPDRPDSYGLSRVGGDDGILNGLNHTMEYKLSAARGWAAAIGTSVNGLPAGVYLIRIKATSTDFASEAVEVGIGAGFAQPGNTALPETGSIDGSTDSVEMKAVAQAQEAEAPGQAESDVKAQAALSQVEPAQEGDSAIVTQEEPKQDDLKQVEPAVVTQEDIDRADPEREVPEVATPKQEGPGQEKLKQDEPEQVETNQAGSEQLEPEQAAPEQVEPVTVKPDPAVTVPEQLESAYLDVKPDDWFYNDVQYVYENGLMTGISSGIFRPNEPITWATLLTVLYRMDGEPDVSGTVNSFGGVYKGAWYEDAAVWAAANGIVSGFEDGIFSPADIIVTREWMAVIFVRYMSYAKIVMNVNDDYRFFADDSQVSAIARGSLQTMNKLGIICGSGDNMINPKGIATRAEFAASLHRFTELKKTGHVSP